MSRTYLLAVLTLALMLASGGVAVAQLADASSETSSAPGGEGYSLPGPGGPARVGNVLLVGWSYNDGSR